MDYNFVDDMWIDTARVMYSEGQVSGSKRTQAIGWLENLASLDLHSLHQEELISLPKDFGEFYNDLLKAFINASNYDGLNSTPFQYAKLLEKANSGIKKYAVLYAASASLENIMQLSPDDIFELDILGLYRKSEDIFKDKCSNYASIILDALRRLDGTRLSKEKRDTISYSLDRISSSAFTLNGELGRSVFPGGQIPIIEYNNRIHVD
jgi:hypothetical protein